ncbi:helix-turn-helix transcriptional regulator [Chelativorans salis]|uniref:helix-turn-helix transcriptional regulator n=1 Tax=Chelativorans salis TaxID=2978478 RepID=UPI0028CB5F14|nr:LuxR C-terminal-related transcriptional regulator [Chelativorans sp. EGI FJ00035]
MLEGETEECVEQGYLLLPVVQQHIETADWDAAQAAAVNAGEIGDRFQEADLIAAARHLQGRVLIHRGAVEKGLVLMDEAMVAVTTEKLSPLTTGTIYCSVIDSCQQVYAFGRAREWTAALAEWCSKQPDLVAFTGKCLVHRAQIMQMSGAWRDAIKEARRISERLSDGYDRQAAAAAFYQQAEVHRLRGEFADAERGYQQASRRGWEPQPGLSLLRMVQGKLQAAASAIERAMNMSADRLQRTRLLPAYVEIMAQSGDIEAARRGAGELTATAEIFKTEVLLAMAAHAQGTVELVEGNAKAALGQLREAFDVWQRVEAPYLAARVRVQIGQACRVLGDIEGALLELEAARAVFEELGAAPDIARLERLEAEPASPAPACMLTRRELQVLRLIASGKTNKAIAAELLVSEKTVDRHVSNIFDKLDVPSRTAATSFGYRHQLI